MNKKPDFGGTTAVNIVWEKAKEKLTLKIVGLTVSAIVLSVGFVLNLQHTSSTTDAATIRLEGQFNELKRQLNDAAKDRALDREKLADISRRIEDMADEVNRQRGEWDRVHGIAETPPHARRRH
jgi:hypothetical protein